MDNLPYVNINYELDENLIEKWWNEFTNILSHTGYIRPNFSKLDDKTITELYGHELFIKSDSDALILKDKVNLYAEKILENLNLEGIPFHVTFMVTNTGILDWHKDEASSTRPQCSAAIMYSLNTDKRAPTEWIYNDVYYKLDGYKHALINCSCMHRVDNSKCSPRRTFRIALYGPTFEEIKSKIIQSGYTI